MNNRQISTICLGAAGLVAAATVSIVAFRNNSAPAPDAAYHQLVQSLPPVKHDDRFSEFYNAAMHHIYNELAPRRQWTINEAAYLSDIIDFGIPAEINKDRDERSLEDIEQSSLYGHAMSLVAERFRLNGAMDPDAREHLQQTLLKELSNPVWNARLSATTNVVYSNLTDNPSIRNKVEQIKKDPDRNVAANAAKQLAHYDRLKQRAR